MKPNVTRRAARRSIVAAIVGLVALSACTSDPGPKRVAQDIIESEAEDDPGLDEECLLGQLDEFSNDDLTAIAEQVDAGNAEGRADLKEFQEALESCR